MLGVNPVLAYSISVLAILMSVSAVPIGGLAIPSAVSAVLDMFDDCHMIVRRLSDNAEKGG